MAESSKQPRQQTKKTVHGGRATVPIVMQMEEVECGAACLTMILAYYGRWMPLENIRADCGVSRDGANAKDIVCAARLHGLKAYGFRLEPEELMEEGSFPCIIHWNFRHFVVLNGFKGDKAVITDPAKGQYTVSPEIFDECFTGVCLFFTPGEGFVTKGGRRSLLSYAAKRLSDAKGAVAFVLLTTLITSMIALIYPGLQRFFVDRILDTKNQEWLIPFIAIAAGFALMQIVLSWISVMYLARVSGRLGVTGCTSYLWHVMHLPAVFFEQRHFGAIDKRKETNAEIGSVILLNFAPLAVNALMIAIYLAAMARYSLLLTLIGLAGIVANVTAVNYVSQKRVNIMRGQFKEENRLAGMTITGYEMIETIKSNGSEDAFFEKWAELQTAVNNYKQQYAMIHNSWGMLPEIILVTVNVLILSLGVLMTMRGQFTAGMILAFQGLMSALTESVSKVADAERIISETRTQVEQVEDVLSCPEDKRYTKDGLTEDGVYDKLRGAVEMKDVSFGYSPLEPPILKNFNMSLKPGSRVAIVGPSGCGKSTIVRLLTGLYQPWTGSIKYDGKTIDEIDHSVFTGSVAVALQEATLFKDTIANNIKMWDKSIEDFEMILAARDACIHDEIMMRDGGYQYIIEEGGHDLSGGQRQRLEITRILAQDPTIVVLDEATSAMDSKTEYDVIKAIEERGITCVIVSHRLSIIRDCDEIIVLNYGEIVERGTHDELYAKNGFYTRLVKSA